MSEMKELARATGILFQAHLVRTMRTRRGLIAAALAGIPVALAFVVQQVSRFEGPAPIEVLISLIWYMLIQVIVPLVALVMASSVIAEEIEDRTITYLFTRPMPRSAILLGRWLAVALPIAAFVGIAAELVVRFLDEIGPADNKLAWMPEGLHARIIVTAIMGGVVYSALFASVGALVKRPMLVGLAYVFVYEGFLGNLPGANQKGTVIFYLRSYLFADHQDLTSDGEMVQALFGTELSPPGAAVRALVLILLVGLALGSWRFAKREYVLSA